MADIPSGDTPPPESYSLDESYVLVVEFTDGTYAYGGHWDRVSGTPTFGALATVVQSALRLLADFMA